MAIKINGQDLLKRFINGQEIVRVYKNGGQIRPETVPPLSDDYLCFTAEQSNSTVSLGKTGNPTVVSLEISYNKTTWMDYNIGGVVTLSNVGDKVYFRNKSETATEFSGLHDYYSFAMTGKIGASGDVNYLLCKNSTTALSNFCFTWLFRNCTSLTTAPQLPATTLEVDCYSGMFTNCTSLTTPPQLPATTLSGGCYFTMFDGCTSLTTLPQLPATRLYNSCYSGMFSNCSGIKLSETQTGEYQTPYRIPSSGTGVEVAYPMIDMFSDTGGTFTGTPSINTTYYTSNQVI